MYRILCLYGPSPENIHPPPAYCLRPNKPAASIRRDLQRKQNAMPLKSNRLGTGHLCVMALASAGLLDKKGFGRGGGQVYFSGGGSVSRGGETRLCIQGTTCTHNKHDTSLLTSPPPPLKQWVGVETRLCIQGTIRTYHKHDTTMMYMVPFLPPP